MTSSTGRPVAAGLWAVAMGERRGSHHFTAIVGVRLNLVAQNYQHIGVCGVIHLPVQIIERTRALGTA